MKKFLTSFAAIVAGIFLCVGAAHSTPLEGDHNFQGSIAFGKISGSNSSNINGGLSFSHYFGWFDSENWLPELGIRQGGSYTFFDDRRDEWLLDTEVFGNVNYVMEDTFWVPYLGVGLGGAYNDQTSTGTATPQGGVKFFVTEQAYIDTSIRYTFPFSNNDIGNGAFVSNLGVGFVWGGDRPSVEQLQEDLYVADQCCARGEACCDKFDDVLQKQ